MCVGLSHTWQRSAALPSSCWCCVITQWMWRGGGAEHRSSTQVSSPGTSDIQSGEISILPAHISTSHTRTGELPRTPLTLDEEQEGKTHRNRCRNDLKAGAADPQSSPLQTQHMFLLRFLTELCHHSVGVYVVRYELHPGVCGSWGVWRLLPIPLENVEQPITRWASDAEPAGHLCVGSDLLHPLQEEDLLENIVQHHHYLTTDLCLPFCPPSVLLPSLPPLLINNSQ